MFEKEQTLCGGAMWYAWSWEDIVLLIFNEQNSYKVPQVSVANPVHWLFGLQCQEAFDFGRFTI